jgi:hypothetical protein
MQAPVASTEIWGGAPTWLWRMPFLTATADPPFECKSTSMQEISYDWQSVGRSILVPGHHLGPATNFLFTSTENIFRHLQFSSDGEPSLISGQFCNLSVQLLHGPADAATLRSKSCRTHGLILLIHLRLSPLFVVSYDPQSYGGGILFHLHTDLSTDYS